MAGRQTYRELLTSYTQTRRQAGKQTDIQTFFVESAQTSRRLAISYMSSQLSGSTHNVEFVFVRPGNCVNKSAELWVIG